MHAETHCAARRTWVKRHLGTSVQKPPRNRHPGGLQEQLPRSLSTRRVRGGVSVQPLQLWTLLSSTRPDSEVPELVLEKVPRPSLLSVTAATFEALP